VKDCTQIILGALSANVDGGMYNVGTGVGVRMEDQVKGIADVFAPEGIKIEISYRADKPDSPEFILDISKTEQELGYKSQYDYVIALKDFKREREINRFRLLWGEEVKE
jgi:UDP-glucose 4-epimerase